MHAERLRPTDAAQYRALMLDAYASQPDAYTSTVAERESLPLDWWRARIAERDAPAEMVLGIRIDGRWCGLAGLQFEARERRRHQALLFGMWVTPVARRRGVGMALVQAVLAQAAARPAIEVVHLTVADGNRDARALYERCGFRPWGVEPMAVRFAEGNDAPARYVARVHMACLVDRVDRGEGKAPVA